MTHLLDMPNDVIAAIVTKCGFAGQAKLACACTQTREAVDTFHRSTGLQRRADPERHIREAIPTVAELLLGEGDRLVTAKELQGALDTYDRVCPEPPGREGELHAWYRKAVDVLEKRDELFRRGEWEPYLPNFCTHIGAVERTQTALEEEREAHGFGMFELHGGEIGRYIGNIKRGKRHGMGLIEWRSPLRAVLHGRF